MLYIICISNWNKDGNFGISNWKIICFTANWYYLVGFALEQHEQCSPP